MNQEVKETIAEKEKTARSPQEKLKEFLATHNVKIARTPEELYAHSVVDDNGEEIEDFLRMREEWRKESRERDFDL